MNALVVITQAKPTLEFLGADIRAHVERGDLASLKSDDHYMAAGLRLVEARKRIAEEGPGGETPTFEAFLSMCGLGRARAFELVAIAEGRTTTAQIRARGAERAAKYARKNRAARSVTNRPTPTIWRQQPYKFEQIGDCTLYLGDCRDVLPDLPTVHHTITDAPYEALAHRPNRQTSKSIREGVDADLGFDAITEELRQFAAEQAARLSSGWALFFCQAEGLRLWQLAVESTGARYHGAACWTKPDSSPRFSGDGPAANFELMALAWCGGGRSQWHAGGKRGTYRHNCNGPSRDGRHRTEKPVALMLELLADFTCAGETVLDPFMGSGTTGVACLRTGRKFIGVERDPAFYRIAAERLHDASSTKSDAANDNVPAPALRLLEAA